MQLTIKDQAFILHALPENYRLFEHIKTNPEKNTKNHAGGGHDRQDAYLYGHPGGRRRRYRSPADFFPHLLWLCTDEDGDEKNCTCKICSPDEIQPDEEKIKSKKKKSEAFEKQSTAPAAPQLVTQPVVATSPPQPRSIDQQLDLQHEQFLSRQGEVVWFCRTDGGGAWALGTIVRRWLVNSTNGRKTHYLIQPLSWPGEKLATVEIASEKTQLRPWLVWSPPPYCHPGLNSHPTLRFDNADWNDISRGSFGASKPLNMTIDGSILAAKAIDCTYTPFELLSSSQEANFSVKRYNGLYLGAEKLWVGDIASINGSGIEDVLVITEIVERTSLSQSPFIPTVTVIGDVYKLVYRAGPEIQNLPQRMREDVKLRNMLIQKQDQRAVLQYWHLAQTNQAIEVDSLRGRWYEATILTSKINDRYEKLGLQEKVMSAVKKINTRLHCVGGDKSLSRYVPDRVQAIGKAVPDGMVISNGIDHPQQAPEQPQAQPQQEQQSEPQQQHSSQLPYDMSLGIEQLGPAGEHLNPQFQGHEEIFGATHAQQPQDYLANTTTAGDFQQHNFFMEQMDLDQMPSFGQEYGGQDHFFQTE